MDVYRSEFMKQNHQPSIIKKLSLILMSALALSLSGLPAASEQQSSQPTKNVCLSTKVSLEKINAQIQGTIAQWAGIQFTGISEEALSAKMPVNQKTQQSMKNLHGGASVLLAETVGLMAAHLTVNDDKYCVPVSSDTSHMRKVVAGENVYVYAVATPLRVGQKTQTWQIKITDDHNQLVCTTTLIIEIRDKHDHTTAEQQSDQLLSELPNDNFQDNVCLPTKIPLFGLNYKVGTENMIGLLGIQFTDIREKSLAAKMPVNNTMQQPMGQLRGAYGVLAETVGTVAANLAVDRNKYVCVGMTIHVSHMRQVPEKGYVYAVATPLHIGKSTQVWQIKITDDQKQLVCAS